MTLCLGHLAALLRDFDSDDRVMVIVSADCEVCERKNKKYAHEGYSADETDYE